MKKFFVRTAAFTLSVLMILGGVFTFLGVTAFASDTDSETTVITGASGVMHYFKEDTYYDMTKPIDTPLTYEFELMANMKSLAYAKTNFDKVEQAFVDAQSLGYGIVLPKANEMNIQEPQIEKKGGRYGVKLKASASAYHVIKVDATTEVSPLMGAELQSEEMVKQLLAQYASEDGVWKNNMMGRPLEEIVSENIKIKMLSTSDEVKKKMRKALCRIVNEGKGGVICILL